MPADSENREPKESGAANQPRPPSQRLASIDVYRGFVMFLMMAEVLKLSGVAKALPDGHSWKSFWAFLAQHQTHVEWLGCTLHDLIQPSFSFLVGVSLPFSLANRAAKGQTTRQLLRHAAVRAVILVSLGVGLRFFKRLPAYFFSFEDTLSQIGLGYFFLFLLACRPRRDQWIALIVILVGYWALFAAYPLPPADFDYVSVNVPADWIAKHGLSGFAAHWNKNANLAWDFDVWMLNHLPQSKPYRNPGGYATLSFIPTLGTMILGLLAGGVLIQQRSQQSRLTWLLTAGVIGLALGMACQRAGLCPIVKRIWTPSWVLFSGGWCFILLAAFYLVLDIAKLRSWAYPLTVIGRNSIAAYVMAGLLESPLIKGLKYLEEKSGNQIFSRFGTGFAEMFIGICVLVVLWLILWAMYRRKWFIRI